MRLIDADKLTNDVIHDMAVGAIHCNAKYFSLINDIVVAFTEMIDNAPTIEAKTKEECDECYCSNWFNKKWTIHAHIIDDRGLLTFDEDLRKYAKVIDKIVIQDWEGKTHEYEKNEEREETENQ